MVNRIVGALDREMVEKAGLPSDMGEYILGVAQGITAVASKHTDTSTPMGTVSTYMELLISATNTPDDAKYYSITIDTAVSRNMAHLVAITAQYMLVKGKFKRAQVIHDIMEFIGDNMRNAGRDNCVVNGDLADVPYQVRCLKVLIHSMTHVYNAAFIRYR